MHKYINTNKHKVNESINKIWVNILHYFIVRADKTLNKICQYISTQINVTGKYYHSIYQYKWT